MEAIERRELERFDLQIPAKIRLVESDSLQKPFDLETRDISSGGAFFHTTEPLPIGTDVSIDLVLNLDRLKAIKEDLHWVHIQVKGTVVRSDSAGMSVSFAPDYQIRPLREKNISS
jgi:c-di-GMP-binding flagellar brake protein YcgR